jgi:hypothetical protein
MPAKRAGLLVQDIVNWFVGPLAVEFTVQEDDRIVTIWAIRHIGELTNGR